MGFFYIGAKVNQRKYAWAKIGMTTNSLAKRAANIRYNEGNFSMYAALEFPSHTSKAVLYSVESHVRMKLEQDGYINNGKDHFSWTFKRSKHNEYEEFAEKGIKHAKKYCDFMGIKYKEVKM